MVLTSAFKHWKLKGLFGKNCTERCVICMEKTKYLYSTPVQERECFIVGCGQLCPRCYMELKKDQDAMEIVE